MNQCKWICKDNERLYLEDLEEEGLKYFRGGYEIDRWYDKRIWSKWGYGKGIVRARGNSYRGRAGSNNYNDLQIITTYYNI